MIIAGFDQDGTPRLYQTEPSGIFSAWKVRLLLSVCEHVRIAGFRPTPPAAAARPCASFLRRTTPRRQQGLSTRPSSWPSRRCSRCVSWCCAIFITFHVGKSQVVQSGSKSIELAVMRPGQPMQV